MGAIILRDAEVSDLPALTKIRSSEAVHRGRLRDAQRSDFRFFVLELAQEIIGFVCLVFHRPQTWSDPDDTRHLPQIVDLYIAETQRNQGYGSEAIHIMEGIVAEAHIKQLYVAVEPLYNPRAYTLYQRLGYQQLQEEPSFHSWEAMDGDGQIQSGELWLVFMMKVVTPLGKD